MTSASSILPPESGQDLESGPIVHGVCAQADGRRAFATVESENSLKVIDTKTNTVTTPSR